MRRAVGDGAIDRIRPHITLVPPLNLKAADLDAALARLRSAAAAAPARIEVSVGPPATFLPANPVLLLGVAGDLAALRALRDAAFAPPLERPLSWPWVPHVTLADGLPPESIHALVTALGRLVLAVVLERVTLLEEVHAPGGRRWEPLADVAFGPPAVVGRGGLELTITAARTPDPSALGLLGEPGVAALVDPATPRRRVVRSAHREGVLVGIGAAWLADDGGHIRVVVAEEHRGTGVGTHLLAAVEDAVRREGWACPSLSAEGPAGFYRARSVWSRPLG